MPRATRSIHSDAIKAIVEPLSAFYRLLSTFPYLPASDILMPPAGGWQQHHIANFRKLGKTDFAVEILTHLPYIRTDSGREWRIGYDDTKPITYVEVAGPGSLVGGAGDMLAALEGDADEHFKWTTRLEPYWQKLDPHVIAITNGWQYGAWLLLDTEAGTIRDFSLLGGISSSIKCPENDQAAGLKWKHFPVVPVKEFFDNYIKKYSSLEWMPIQENNGAARGDIFSQEQMGTASKDLEIIRKIYIDHGWDTAKFRKEDCRKALIAWRKDYGERVLKENDQLYKANRRSPSPPDPLDEFSD